MILGWAALMALFLAWTQYKGGQAKERMKQIEAQKADSLAKAESRKTVSETSLAPAPAPAATSPDSSQAASVAARPDSLAPAAPSAPRRRIRVETPRFTAVLDNRGARIAELRIYDLEGKPAYNPVLIDPQTEGALTLTVDNRPLDEILWRTETADTLIRLGAQPVTVAFAATLQDGGEVTRRYTFLPDKPAIRHEASLPRNVSSYALEWKGGLSETEKILQGQGIGLTSGFFSEVIFDNGVTVRRESFEGDKTFNAESGVIRWLGMRRKYVAVLLDFHKEIQEKVEATSQNDPGLSKDAPKRYSLRVAGNADEPRALDFDVMVLPLRYKSIKAMERNYEQILFSGWEWFLRADIWYVKLCGMVLNLLNVFFQWIPNYGVAIILLTLLVRLVTLPLSITQIKQAARMAEHQPEIRRIQEKNRGDRQKTQLEIMEYYRKKGINPLAPVMGCFPVLLQMPVFISLFNVLGRAVELHDTPFIGWIRDLSQPDVILPALKVPFIFPVGFTVLPFLMAGTMWVQMKMTIKDPNQKMMIWLMPIMMFVFSCSFPSGLVLNWTVSNVFTIAQTKVFTPKPAAAAETGHPRHKKEKVKA
jgi:YidC/Oxa1 family membrane protein insertase